MCKFVGSQIDSDDEDPQPNQHLLEMELFYCNFCKGDFYAGGVKGITLRQYFNGGYSEVDGFICNKCSFSTCECGSKQIPFKKLKCHDKVGSACDDCTLTCDLCRTTKCLSCFVAIPEMYNFICFECRTKFDKAE